MPEHRRWTQHGACRAVSLLLAAPLGLLLLIHPGSMVGADGHYSHPLLMLVMAGICAGFIHGVGFTPASAWARGLTHPLLSGCLLGYGYWLLMQASA